MNWTELSAILGAVVAFFSLLGWLWTQVGKLRDDARQQQNDGKNDFQKCMGEIDALREKLYLDYMPIGRFDKTADHLTAQITALSEKIDTKIDGLRADLESKIDRMRDDQRSQRT